MNIKRLFFSVLCLLSFQSNACDFSLGAGPTFRASFSGKSASTGGGNVISAQCAFEKWIVQGDYFTKQKLEELVPVEPYPMLTVLRRWSMSAESTRLPPFFQVGLSFKEADTCKQDLRCNPLAPSPVSVTFGFGFTTKKLEFLLRHTSNAGISEPNWGQDSLVVFYRF